MGNVIHTLQLIRKRREGERLENGGYKTERDYHDFVINDIPLSTLVENEGLDKISCLWLPGAVQRLLLNSPADFPDNRRSLYICPECGGLDCGAISVVIEMDETTVIWRDFGYQTDWQTEVFPVPAFDKLGILIFNRQDYEHLLQNLK